MRANCLVLLLLVHFVLIASAFCRDESVRTKVSELSLLEKLLVKLHNPKIPLRAAVEFEKGKEPFQANYNGDLELGFVEIPILLLQLVKFGNEFELPSFTVPIVIDFCYPPFICFGVDQKYHFKRPIVSNAAQTQVKTNVNGSFLHIEFNVPNLVVNTPEFIFDSLDTINEERQIWRGATHYIGNLTTTFTGNFTLGTDGLQVSDVNLGLGLDDLRYVYDNGTLTQADGSTIDLGRYEEQRAPDIAAEWEYEAGVIASAALEYWLNCFLDKKQSGSYACQGYLDENLHHQTFAQFFHGLGLAAFNHEREQSS